MLPSERGELGKQLGHRRSRKSRDLTAIVRTRCQQSWHSELLWRSRKCLRGTQQSPSWFCAAKQLHCGGGLAKGSNPCYQSRRCQHASCWWMMVNQLTNIMRLGRFAGSGQPTASNRWKYTPYRITGSQMASPARNTQRRLLAPQVEARYLTHSCRGGPPNDSSCCNAYDGRDKWRGHASVVGDVVPGKCDTDSYA